MYFVDHPVRPNTDSPGWSTGEFHAAGRTRLVGEGSNGIKDALVVNLIDLGELLLSSSQDFDRVGHAS